MSTINVDELKRILTELKETANKQLYCPARPMDSEILLAVYNAENRAYIRIADSILSAISP